MSVLIVGAGAAGGYIGAALIAGGRDVTFLVRPKTLARLDSEGLRIRRGDDVATTRVDAVTVAGLPGSYDVVVVAVRTDAVESAVHDIHGAVGMHTRIVPVMNGIKHLATLTAEFGEERVLGAATRLVTSQLPDGTIDEVVAGIDMQIGQLDGSRSTELERTAEELGVDAISVSVRSDIIAAMWDKFAFITSTAVLTCLIGDEIGPIASADGGIALARRVLGEVAEIAAADGSALSDQAQAALAGILTDQSSTFGPSMFRDMSAGRRVELTVLEDLAARARQHRLTTPLLDAALVAVDVHNRHARAAG